MDEDLLRKHIKSYSERHNKKPAEYLNELKDRQDRLVYYQSWTNEKLLQMREEDLFDYIGRLWAMLI